MSVTSNTSQYTPATMRRGISPLRENPPNYHESPLRQVPPLYPLTMVDSELSHTKICGKGMIDKILGKQESNREVILPFGGYHPYDGVEVPDSPVTMYSPYDGNGAVGDAMPEAPTDENALQFSPAQIRLSADKHGVEAQHTPISRKSNASPSSSVGSNDKGSYSTPSSSSRKSNKSSSSSKSKSLEKRRLPSLFRRKPPTPFRRSERLPAVVEVPSADASDTQQESSTLENKSNTDGGRVPSTAVMQPVSTSSSSISTETDAVLQAMRDLVLKQQEALKALAEEKAQYAKELEMQRMSVSTLQTVNQEQTEKINLLASTNQQVQTESEWLREQIQAIRYDMMSLHKTSTRTPAHKQERQHSGHQSQTGNDNVFVKSSRNGHGKRQGDRFGNTNRDTYLGIPPREKSTSFTDSDSLTNESGADSFPVWTKVGDIKDLYETENRKQKEKNVPSSVLSAGSTAVTRPVANLGAVRSDWGDSESMFASLSDESLAINLNATPTQSFDVFQSNDGGTTVLTPKGQNENNKILKPALRATKITVSRVDSSPNRSVKFNSPLSETNGLPQFSDDVFGDKSPPPRKRPSQEEIGLFRNRLEALQERREQRKARQTTIRWDENFLKGSKEEQRLGYF